MRWADQMDADAEDHSDHDGRSVPRDGLPAEHRGKVILGPNGDVIHHVGRRPFGFQPPKARK